MSARERVQIGGGGRGRQRNVLNVRRRKAPLKIKHAELSEAARQLSFEDEDTENGPDPRRRRRYARGPRDFDDLPSFSSSSSEEASPGSLSLSQSQTLSSISAVSSDSDEADESTLSLEGMLRRGKELRDEAGIRFRPQKWRFSRSQLDEAGERFDDHVADQTDNKNDLVRHFVDHVSRLTRSLHTKTTDARREDPSVGDSLRRLFKDAVHGVEHEIEKLTNALQGIGERRGPAERAMYGKPINRAPVEEKPRRPSRVPMPRSYGGGRAPAGKTRSGYDVI